MDRVFTDALTVRVQLKRFFALIIHINNWGRQKNSVSALEEAVPYLNK